MTIAKHIAAATFTALALSAVAVAQADQGPARTLLWDCARDGAPSLAEVKQLFDTGNNSYASTLRLRLQARLRAECQRGSGSGQVLFALQRPVEDEAVAVIASRSVQDMDR
jgi:hypothetical protein